MRMNVIFDKWNMLLVCLGRHSTIVSWWCLIG